METEKYTSKDVELRSEEANDILNTPPTRILQIINLIIFFITIILLLLSLIISIPIYSKIPIHLESFTKDNMFQEGEIMLNKLIVKPVSLQIVEKDQIIGILDTTADYNEINKLDKLIKRRQYEKSIFNQIHASNLGGFKSIFLKYKFKKISYNNFYSNFVDWKKKNLIISNKKGKLFIEILKSGNARYKIYPEEDHLKFMVAEFSTENISQLKKKYFILTVMYPKRYKNQKVKLYLLNNKYNIKKNKVIFEVQKPEEFLNEPIIDGQINVLLKKHKLIYLLFPFIEKK